MILDKGCMINGYSIRECAEIVEIIVPTSFYWRHKFLDAIRVYMGIGNVGGVIEVDEAFFRESFKGNHKKSTMLCEKFNIIGNYNTILKRILLSTVVSTAVGVTSNVSNIRKVDK